MILPPLCQNESPMDFDEDLPPPLKIDKLALWKDRVNTYFHPIKKADDQYLYDFRILGG